VVLSGILCLLANPALAQTSPLPTQPVGAQYRGSTTVLLPRTNVTRTTVVVQRPDGHLYICTIEFGHSQPGAWRDFGCERIGQ
jgi:hypothetical protein